MPILTDYFDIGHGGFEVKYDGASFEFECTNFAWRRTN